MGQAEMQPNATADEGFARTGKRPRAVELVAEDRLTDVEIAKELGINKVTLERWKKHPEFARTVDNARQAVAEALRLKGIALKQNRIDAYNRRWGLLEDIRAARGADEWLSDVPGGSTGLVVKQLKTVKHHYIPDPDDEDGKPSQMLVETWESAVDTGLLREWRELEKQAAQDVGDWTEKREVTGANGGPLEIVEVEVTRTVRTPVEGVS